MNFHGGLDDFGDGKMLSEIPFPPFDKGGELKNQSGNYSANL